MDVGDELREQGTPERAFQSALDRHGYGFQYSVIQRAWDLLSARISNWIPHVSEFPATVRGSATHIDLILHHRDRSGQHLICECKRVNPALADWCFAKAAFQSRGSKAGGYRVERVRYANTGSALRVEGYDWTASPDSYDIALEVKSRDVKGDTSGPGRGAIDEAVAQVLRGTNGILDYVAQNPSLVRHHKAWILVPVIFTTARLWVSDVSLHTADLLTGKIDHSTAKFSRSEWLVMRYHQSPSLKHSVTGTDLKNSLSQVLETEFTRSVAIVSADGIDKFLAWSSAIADYATYES